MSRTEGCLSQDSYGTRVLVSGVIEDSILKTVAEYNTVCVGLSEQSAVSRILFGSLAERVGRQATGNVMMIRGPKMGHRTVREAIVERLS